MFKEAEESYEAGQSVIETNYGSLHEMYSNFVYKIYQVKLMAKKEEKKEFNKDFDSLFQREIQLMRPSSVKRLRKEVKKQVSPLKFKKQEHPSCPFHHHSNNCYSGPTLWVSARQRSSSSMFFSKRSSFRGSIDTSKLKSIRHE